ncbi:unnamed protein product, partial [Porites evermanni]
LSRLKEETSALMKERDHIQYKLEKNVIFQQYLEKFQEIREVIARYDTLTATHQDLLERETKNQEKYEKEKGRLVKFTEVSFFFWSADDNIFCTYFCFHFQEKNNEILNYNNQLAHLQTKLERAQSVAVKCESQWTHIQNTAAKKTLLLGRIKMATHNLFMLVNRHLKQNTVIEVTEKQLEKIQVFIQDLTQITNEIKRAETAAISNE